MASTRVRRISLTYDAPTGTGKTTAHTDTYHGRFVKLVTNEQVVEVSAVDNEIGWQEALAKLAALVEVGQGSTRPSR